MGLLIALVYWLHLLALALWAGGLVALLVVLPSGKRVHPEDVALLESARHRTQTIMLCSVVGLIVTLAAEISLRTLSGTMAGGFIVALRTMLFGSRYGVASVVRWLVVVAALGAVDEMGRAAAPAPARAPQRGRHALGIVASPPRLPRVALSPRAWLRVVALLAVALLIATAVAGPYGGSAGTAIVDVLHLSATAVWFGGTMVLALVVTPFIPLVGLARRPMALLALLDRFTPLAALSVLVVVPTGLWESAHSLPHSDDLFTTPLGLAIPLKAVVLLLMVALSAWSLLVLRPRLRRLGLRARRESGAALTARPVLEAVRRLLWVNPVLAVLALGLSTVAYAYPIHEGPVTASGQAGAIDVTLGVRPNQAGANDVDLRLSDAAGLPVRGARVELAATSLEMHGMDPAVVAATELGAGHYRARDVLTMGGRWQLTVSLWTQPRCTLNTVDFTIATIPLHRPMSALTRASALTPASAVAGICAWQRLGPSGIMHSLAADPANHARLYLAGSHGVYRSLDGGAHWALAASGLPDAEVLSLSFIPDGSLIAATGAGVYRSTDNAAHWRAIGLGTHSVYTLATHMSDHIALLAGADGGIFRSDNLGASWRQVYSTGTNAGISSLAWPAQRPSLVVAGISPGVNSVVVSRDGGATWHLQTTGLPAWPGGMMSVAVAPGVHDVYAGMMGDGAYILPGISGAWQARNTGLPGLGTGDAHVASFAFDPSRPDTIYIGTTGFGVYRSEDAGRHWASFGANLRGDDTVVTGLTLVSGPHPSLYATTATGLYRLRLAA